MLAVCSIAVFLARSSASFNDVLCYCGFDFHLSDFPFRFISLLHSRFTVLFLSFHLPSVCGWILGSFSSLEEQLISIVCSCTMPLCSCFLHLYCAKSEDVIVEQPYQFVRVTSRIQMCIILHAQFTSCSLAMTFDAMFPSCSWSMNLDAKLFISFQIFLFSLREFFRSCRSHL